MIFFYLTVRLREVAGVLVPPDAEQVLYLEGRRIREKESPGVNSSSFMFRTIYTPLMVR